MKVIRTIDCIMLGEDLNLSPQCSYLLSHIHCRCRISDNMTYRYLFLVVMLLSPCLNN